jgi:hypothetical protein
LATKPLLTTAALEEDMGDSPEGSFLRQINEAGRSPKPGIWRQIVHRRIAF